MGRAQNLALWVAVAGVSVLSVAPARAAYTVRELVSDPAGAAPVTDPNLSNAWGLTSSPTSPFWVGSNGRGVATLYHTTDSGQTFAPLPLVVSIPAGAPTGTIFNSAGAGNFVLSTGPASGAATFLFATENGHISGWNSAVPTGGSTVATDGFFDPTAVYKGVTLASATINSVTSNFLYATDFRNNKIRVLNSAFAPATLPGSFTDPNEPAGFAPFNIANLAGTLYVSYAKQDDLAHDDVAGLGNGFIDRFDPSGNFLGRFATGGPLDSPWAMVLAPSNFGEMSNDLLVGNFGNGKINAYDPASGALIGPLNDPTNTDLQIDGLWAMQFGNGSAAGPTNTLFFTAGPNAETQGEFGAIDVATAQGSVPEPGAVALILGTIGAALMRRRVTGAPPPRRTRSI